MTTFSKYFQEAVQRYGCNTFIHDGSCWHSTVWNFTRIIPGCVQFVLPLALVIRKSILKLDKHILNLSLFRTDSGHNENTASRQRRIPAKSSYFYRLFLGRMACRWLWFIRHMFFEVSLYIQVQFRQLHYAHLIHGLSLLIFVFCRKLIGYFNYYTVLGVPSGLGAAISSFMLADRAVYHYAHGLSTIVMAFCDQFSSPNF